MDDVALVQQAAALDKDAFGVVYERYATRLYDFLWWVLQDREEAAYALYDTFLEAGARLSELKDPSKLRPWLFAIASDQALRHRRRPEKGESNGQVTNPPPADPTPERDAAWGELKQVVRAVATDLSPQDRALLDLRFRQDLDDDELAEAVGTTPERATDLMERLTERVENLLGETVVAFLGRRDCPTLTEALGPWDDRLDARQREVVEQHVPTCATCGERRQRRIPASALLGVSPAVAVPGGVAERVLQDVELAAHHGRPWAARRNGFPPPLIGYRHRQRLAVGAAAAAIVLVLVAAGYIVSRGGGQEQVASTGSTSVPSTTVRPSTTFTTLLPTSTSALPPVGDALAPAAPGVATTRAPNAGTGGGGTGDSTNTTAPAETSNTTQPTTSETTQPSTTTPTPTPTSPPTTADATAPTINSVSASPGTVRGGSKCSNTTDPATTTVTANVTDGTGVASVRVVAAGLSTMNVPMTATGGGNYTAVIGPFDSPVPPGFDLPELPVVVRALDAAGNQSTAQTTIKLRCTA